jgi:tRNA 5-methylaminomethyl-2-thiouridine biosynthesis bifunctional protein
MRCLDFSTSYPNDENYYDVIVVGAGIAGCCSAFFLKQRGLKVLVVDRAGVASMGGSSAAGAFVSPKIGKGSALQKLTNEAFEFAKDFYLQYFPKHFYQTGIIRMPKDRDDAKKFDIYEKHNYSKHRWITKDELEEIGIKESYDSFLFDEAGVCDAQQMCKALLEGIEFEQYEVERLLRIDGHWEMGESRAEHLILAVGYENTLCDMRYMGVRGTWGSRGDYESSLELDISMHKQISISANIDGIIKLGATHNKAQNPCMVCDGEPLKGLFETASTMVDSSDFRLKEIFCGMRSGSKDYFPLLGGVIDVPYMLESYPKIVRGQKVKELKKIEGLYVCNGVGGRGFVFAPMMGKILAESIVDGIEVDSRLNPDRLFLKWCRKL